MVTWLEHVEKWKDCTKCALHTQRSNIVLARGQLPADVVFVGEAPGAVEDSTGLPFKGPAGALLDQIIDRALPEGVTWALTNLVCCFPREAKWRGDNEPELAEIRACRPRLLEFLEIARPRLVVCVGTLAGDYVQHDAYGKVLGANKICIIHPAATFPPRMPRAQQGMAINRAIVTVRHAVEDMLNTTREVQDASIQPPQ